jgi:hypothetical protein
MGNDAEESDYRLIHSTTPADAFAKCSGKSCAFSTLLLVQVPCDVFLGLFYFLGRLT